ncbi:hypothetical protein B4079_2363 [Bacillus cereus]|nr:hypothetical protein B4079_2363 [Bacillus cereus]
MPTRSPPYTAVFTHHFTCVYCISKILSCKKILLHHSQKVKYLSDYLMAVRPPPQNSAEAKADR